MAWRAPLAGWLSACLLLAPFIAPSAARSTARFESNPCPFTPPEGLSVACGTLVVPEQRNADASSAEVRLAVARVAANHPSSRDPVLYLAGGPGSPASTDLP